MVAKLNPRYQFPSRKYFSNMEIPQLFHHAKDCVVLSKLREAQYYAGTTDTWTSAGCQPFMSFTVHLIDRGWDLQSFSLDTFSVIADHRSQYSGSCNGCSSKTGSCNLLNWSQQLWIMVQILYQHMRPVCISCFGCNLDLVVKKCPRNERVQSVWANVIPWLDCSIAAGRSARTCTQNSNNLILCSTS